MTSSFQAVALVAAPLYPNAVVWSDENLIAVASGHLVTILNPAMPYGPRGLITIRNADPYRIGTIKREDLLSGCMLSTSLSRDRSPCVRSISWSPVGMAPNSGCFLAVCTVEGRVKLFSPPFSDFRAEWIEIMDISDMLYNYLSKINFGESDISSIQLYDGQTIECGTPSNKPNSEREHKHRRVTLTGNKVSKPCWDLVPCSGNDNSTNTGSKSLKRMSRASSDSLNGMLPLITAEQYASCSALLHSTVVSWSPMMMRASSQFCSDPRSSSSNGFSLLAIGGKSGRISFWRIHAPQCYSIDRGDPPAVTLVGLLEAHNTRVTAISWSLFPSDCSSQQVFLVTGSSDGSVKIWLGHSEELLKPHAGKSPFSLEKEVIPVNLVPLSVLSVLVPVQSPCEMLLAVGEGSGSLEVWKYDMSCFEIDKVGSCIAHDQVVTGIVWAFDGRCLYSCSQDNFVRSWILCGNSIVEVPLPSNTPGLRSSTDLPDIFVSSLGVATSPGNLVLAMVRSYDPSMLDQMYEARVQKAALEFLWIGGQQLETTPTTSQFDIKAFPGFSEKELVYWESNIMWSLKQYEHLAKPLVVWDIIVALLFFKHSIPEYVEHILLKWLSTVFPGSKAILSAEKILSAASKSLSKITSRQLHLLNVICRRIMLLDMKAEEINSKEVNTGKSGGAEGKATTLWMELLLSIENELRQRLVWLTFSSLDALGSSSATSPSKPGYWFPVGLAQMEQWVEHNKDHVDNQLKVLASNIRKQKKRILSDTYVAEERCSICSALVPFISPEVALCQGRNGNGENQSHKLERCAASMQICPMSSLWFCKCCSRWIFKLPPETLFAMPAYPSDDKTSVSPIQEVLSRPLCPLCGILLQRLQPEFLLSPSPV